MAFHELHSGDTPVVGRVVQVSKISVAEWIILKNVSTEIANIEFESTNIKPQSNIKIAA